MKSQDRVTEHYDNAPQLFPEIRKDTLSSLECRTFSKFLSLYQPGAHATDLGCGTGRVGRYMARVLRPKRLTFFEISPEELRLCEEFGSEADLSSYVRGDLLQLPFKNLRFCACHGVVHHTPDPDRAMAEISRALAPGGIVFLAVYAKSWYGILHKALGLLRGCRRVGIESVVTLAYYGYFAPRYILRVLESKTFARNFNIRGSFEDFVMTPYAYCFSDSQLRARFGTLGLTVIDHEKMNYGVLHCYVLEKVK